LSVHRFIVYQYGKVGSTSLTAALNKLPRAAAYQAHFLGEAAFTDTVRRLMSPDMPEYFFSHATGQLLENLRIYRHYLRRGLGPDLVTVVTVAREPFDWFRSAISQDIDEHLVSLRRMLAVRDRSADDDATVVIAGLGLLFERLLEAVAHMGSVDALCDSSARYAELRKLATHVDDKDFRAFMFLLNIFLRPHVWFDAHFRPVTGVGPQDMRALDNGVLCHRQDWGGIYLLRYETLAAGFDTLLDDLGHPGRVGLPRRNVSEGKRFATQLEAAFATAAAARLRAQCHSRSTRLLGYAGGA